MPREIRTEAKLDIFGVEHHPVVAAVNAVWAGRPVATWIVAQALGWDAEVVEAELNRLRLAGQVEWTPKGWLPVIH